MKKAAFSEIGQFVRASNTFDYAVWSFGEKPAKTAKVKDKKPNVFVRMGRSIKKFFKELRGESKKVVWPDRKTVLKSSLVVIVSVVIIGVVIWLIDTGLSELVKLLINLASKSGGGAGAATAGAITANFFSL